MLQASSIHVVKHEYIIALTFSFKNFFRIKRASMRYPRMVKVKTISSCRGDPVRLYFSKGFTRLFHEYGCWWPCFIRRSNSGILWRGIWPAWRLSHSFIVSVNTLIARGIQDFLGRHPILRHYSLLKDFALCIIAMVFCTHNIHKLSLYAWKTKLMSFHIILKSNCCPLMPLNLWSFSHFYGKQRAKCNQKSEKI